MKGFKELYTVEDIAQMTALTSRTIRNYLKDGKLKGKKVGGQWRFTKENIDALFKDPNFTKTVSDEINQEILDFIEGVNTDIKGNVQICSIIDYYYKDKKFANEMSEEMVAIINNEESEFKYARFHFSFLEAEKKGRFILFGEPEFIAKVVELSKKYVDND